MDPISLTAGIFSILASSSKVIFYLTEVKTAKEERKKLLLEITSARGVLFTIKDLAEHSEDTGAWTTTIKTLDQPGGPLEQFKETLQYLASKLEKGRNAKKLGKLLSWPFEKDDIQNVFNRLERLKSVFGLALLNDHGALLLQVRDSLKAVDSKIDGITEGLEKINLLQKNQRNAAILDWLSPLNFSSLKNDLLSRRQPGTGSWLVESAIFRNWLSRDFRTLFCPGMPGVGKSTLASVVVEHLENQVKSSAVSVVYVFYTYRDRHSQTPIRTLSSILEQIFRQTNALPSNLIKIYDAHQLSKTTITFEEVSDLLQNQLARLDHTYLVIDALDECDRDSQPSQDCLSKIFEFQSMCNLSLLVTSRTTEYARRDFRKAEKLEIRATEHDISQYLRNNVQNLRVKVSDELRETIVREVTARSDGMFLLAQLHMESIRAKPTLKAIKVTLQNTPGGTLTLGQTYDHAWTRINQQDPESRDLARRALSWITHARRPLTFREQQHALAIEPGSSDLDEDNIPDFDLVVSVGAGLLTVDNESYALRLVHHTAQEYFQRRKTDLLPAAEEDISRSCLTYLCYDVFKKEITAETMEKYPLMRYSYENWGDHIRGEPEQSLQNLATGFLNWDCKATNFMKVLWGIVDDEGGFNYAGDDWMRSGFYNMYFMWQTPLHWSAWFGLEHLTRSLFEQSIQPDVKDERGRTPISIACAKGWLPVVKILASSPQIDVNGHADNDFEGKPLHAAAALDQVDVVRYLLSLTEVDVDSTDTDGRTACSLATDQRPPSMKSLYAILGANPKIDPNALVRSAIHRGRAHVEIANLFIDHPDMQINKQSSPHGETLLHEALSGGDNWHYLAIDILKRNDVNINLRGFKGRTALHTACQYKVKLAFLELLKRPDVDVNASDDEGKTALHIAWMYGMDFFANTLLARDDIDLNRQNQEGNTIFHEAAFDRSGDAAEKMKILVRRPDIKFGTKNADGYTALHILVWNEQVAMLEMILSRPDLDVNTPESSGYTALHIAAGGKLEQGVKMVRLLLQRPDINTWLEDGEGRTALEMANEYDQKDIFNVLQQYEMNRP